jgi:DNA-binding MarR family transcriptional regulator
MDEPFRVEVTLTEDDVVAAGRLLSQIVRTGGADAGAAHLSLIELASRIHRARRERLHYFSDELFSDPGWDMILSLYCAEGRGERLSVTALGHTVGLPQTTAVRWIKSLSEAGLIERERDEHDRRRSFLRLTATTSEKVTHWLTRSASFWLLSSSGAEGR